MKSNRVCQAGLSLFFIFCGTAVPADEIYKWVDAKGVVHYSDTAPEIATSTKTITTLVLPELNTLETDHLQDFPKLAAKTPRSPTAKLIGKSRHLGDKDRGVKESSADSEYSEQGLQYYRWIPNGYPYAAGFRHSRRCQGQWLSKHCQKAGRFKKRERWSRDIGHGLNVYHRTGRGGHQGIGRTGRRSGVGHGFSHPGGSLRLTVRH